MTALVVEDNEANFILVREILRHLGWRAEQAATAKQLHDILSRFSPDLIVMDISLPDGDGLELTRKLRTDGLKAPIVVMSAHAFAEVRHKAVEAGANAFFPKPFDLSELERIITDITSDRTLSLMKH